MKNIGILGSGTWGTALANMLVRMGHKITLWSKFEKDSIRLRTEHTHPNLPGSIIESDIVFATDLKDACLGQDFVIFATPSPYIRETAERCKPYLNKEQILITVAKGIEKDTLFTMSEIIKDVLGQDYKVAALSGPTHAEEVAIGLPTLIVSACEDEEVAQLVQKEVNNDVLRVYTNTDIKGVELCGALKNIIALASGMSEGLGFGDNAKAAIITRGLAEITRLGLAMGCHEGTFSGLTGIGDIVVTATSNNSRNHNAGVLIGKGYSLKDTLEKVGMVVEGVNALDAAKELEIKYNVELPIIDVVYAIVKQGVPVSNAIPMLFGRKPKSEISKRHK